MLWKNLYSKMTAHELYVSLIAKVKVANYNLLSIGKTLKELKEGDKFMEATGSTDTWQHFVKSPEVSMTVGEANKLIDLYETFVDRLGYTIEQLSVVPMKNLKILLPLTKNYPENFEELFEQAKVLSDKDLKDALIETSDTMDEVPRTYKYMIMKKCLETGNMSKVHDVASDEIDTMLQRHDYTR